MIQRGGQVGIRILEDVRQTTSQPLIEATIQPGTLVPTDEYTIYKRLPEWGFEHQTVCHNAGEDARSVCCYVSSLESIQSLLFYRPVTLNSMALPFALPFTPGPISP